MNHSEILHRARQYDCRALCKNSDWFSNQIGCFGWLCFGEFLVWWISSSATIPQIPLGNMGSCSSWATIWHYMGAIIHKCGPITSRCPRGIAELGFGNAKLLCCLFFASPRPSHQAMSVLLYQGSYADKNSCNSLRPSDIYMHQQSNHHQFR